MRQVKSIGKFIGSIRISVLCLYSSGTFYEPDIHVSYYGLRYHPIYFRKWEIMFNMANLYSRFAFICAK